MTHLPRYIQTIEVKMKDKDVTSQDYRRMNIYLYIYIEWSQQVDDFVSMGQMVRLQAAYNLC